MYGLLDTALNRRVRRAAENIAALFRGSFVVYVRQFALTIEDIQRDDD
jgi:hypothetical protein